jgi:cytochrome c
MRICLIPAFGLLILSFPAFADREAGRDVFRAKCIGCHAFQCNRNGPKLGGLIGRTAGTISDFDGYSDAMKKSGIVWDKKTLYAYLTDPDSVVSNNAMASFGKIENETDRRNLIDFLIEPDTSLDICF